MTVARRRKTRGVAVAAPGRRRCSRVAVAAVAVAVAVGLGMVWVCCTSEQLKLKVAEDVGLLLHPFTCREVRAGSFPTDVEGVNTANVPVPTLSIRDGGGHGWPQQPQQQPRRKDGDTSGSRSSPPSPLPIPPELARIGYRPPRIYIAEKEAWAVFNQREEACAPGTADLPERVMHLLLRSNVTGSIVMDPSQAEWIYIPFLTVHTCGVDVADQHVSFDQVFRAVQPLGRRFILFTARPWNALTLLRMNTQTLLDRYPDMVVWSPEVRTLQVQDLRHPNRRQSRSLRRHVAVQQPPLLMNIPEHVFAPEWARHYEFCFQGTLLNQQRTSIAEVLRARNDSFVFGSCRSTRTQLMFTKLSPDESRRLYSRCHYCIMPMGDSLTDQRFFDAMMVGCIPVIFEPLKPLPFAQFLDYASFTRHVRNARSRGALWRELEAIHATPREQRVTMRRALLHAVKSISFAREHAHAGLHFALALTVMSDVDDRDLQLQHAEHEINRLADLEGWWGLRHNR
ncbi:hypothetical protein PTSG_02439 [Salpingoeca rosetta]|uniref:Exostosin GT47 domain-containing protein n=1 Tax=Salpingoeca rosetta (strain ATCC 50818 / BSB-021) TaxID=946362 RepID=F2U276_SALR5|nr:uncharacterized protein PTSG_02439 [Salpingoeca rosetta]EGD81728.1 hypothetical protein PTSG_02439 [Salpingoeca rosetta]|eukprot:XP_004996932.1 hypothetical protein PTSG_02439 [Salpingoeca rosetta]